MKICYVSMAFGVKQYGESGHTIDHDRIYRELILPAVQNAGLSCQRADDFSGSLIGKDIARAVITADVMLADVSNGNANVMYELGIRHGLRRGATVLLTSTRLPFDISNNYALSYQVAGDGGPEPAGLEAIRAHLTEVLLAKAESTVSDSPLYEYFPELRIELPTGLQPPKVRRRAYPPEAQVGPVRGPDRKTAVERAERVTRGAVDVDPQAYLDLLRRYRDLSAWDDVVRLASELPADVAVLPQVAQTVALAQGRLGNTDAAIDVLNRQLLLSGDPETCGLLGSLYKKRHFARGSVEDLDAAIELYRKAFEGNPHDLYFGRNLAQLLHRKGGDKARDELAKLLPELRSLCEQTGSKRDYWLISSAMILAVIAADWPAAEEHISQMRQLRPEAWMLDATRTELQGFLERTFGTPSERGHLLALMERLQSALASEEAEEAEEADGAQL